MTTIIITRFALLKAWYLETFGIPVADDVESLDEFGGKYEMTMAFKAIWKKDASLLDDIRASDPAVDAACNCWEGGGTLEQGHVLMWP